MPLVSCKTPHRSPWVRVTAFPAQLPDLHQSLLIGMDFVMNRPLVQAYLASYLVSVRQLAGLLHASFRPCLTTTPLRFTKPSPLSGWLEDFHLLVVCHARHTSHGLALRLAFPFTGELRAYQVPR